MAVELPTTAEVREIRHNAARTAAERAGAARTPLLAVLGAGDLAVNALSKAVAEARTRATEARVQDRVADLPQRLNSEELRKALDELRVHAEQAYADFAEQGERTWGRLREQPQVKDALARFDSYTEKLDARVDDLVDDSRDAAEKALTAVTSQTRSTGERVARATQRFGGRAAQTLTDVSADVARTVADTGSDAADAVDRAGGEVAHETRSTTRKAAGRATPKTTSKAGASKPPAPRTAAENDGGSGS